MGCDKLEEELRIGVSQAPGLSPRTIELVVAKDTDVEIIGSSTDGYKCLIAIPLTPTVKIHYTINTVMLQNGGTVLRKTVL